MAVHFRLATPKLAEPAHRLRIPGSKAPEDTQIWTYLRELTSRFDHAGSYFVVWRIRAARQGQRIGSGIASTPITSKRLPVDGSFSTSIRTGKAFLTSRM